jgi:uncharacterized protein (TIGR00251 family)
MALPPYLKVQDGVVLLHVKVQPRASRNAIGDVLGDELKIQITAPPVDSAANQALLEFLAERLECPRRSIQLVRGATSRHKVIALSGLPAEAIAGKLS